MAETARLVSEHALEHWRDAESGNEESHMTEHQAESHRGEDNPMRGNVLNKKGAYNKCKLTCLVVDSEWDEKVWKSPGPLGR